MIVEINKNINMTNKLKDISFIIANKKLLLKKT